MLKVRIEYPNGSVVTVPYLGSFYWRTSQSPRLIRASTQAVLGVTTKAAFTQTSIVSSSGDDRLCVPVIHYVTPKEGVQVMACGDSIPQGVGSTVRDLSYVARACYDLSTPDAPIVYFNSCLHAQTPDVYSRHLETLVPVVMPGVLFYSPYSVNDVASGTGLADDALARLKGSLSRVMSSIRSAIIKPVFFLLEAFPVNDGFRSYGANDSKRIALNTTFYPSVTGAEVMTGTAAAVSGVTSPAGQVQLAAALVASDQGHLNDAGHDTVKPYFVSALLEVI